MPLPGRGEAAPRPYKPDRVSFLGALALLARLLPCRDAHAPGDMLLLKHAPKRIHSSDEIPGRDTVGLG